MANGIFTPSKPLMLILLGCHLRLCLRKFAGFLTSQRAQDALFRLASLLTYASYAKVLTQGQSAERQVECLQAIRGLGSLDLVNSLGAVFKTLS